MTKFDWYLDDFRTKDKAALIEHLQDPVIHKFTSNIPFPYTDKDADNWIRMKKKEKERNGVCISFAIRSRDSSLIGGIGFDGVQVGKTHAAELGYWLAKPFRNQGIMTAVVNEACHIGFTEFGLVRIQAVVFPNNPASARVLSKCGFCKEGYLRKYLRKNGEYEDVELFSLIKT